MIEIIESECKKLSGLSSLFVKFPYNQEIINCIKRLDRYSYDKKTYLWEIPTNQLAAFLDDVTYLDDIKLTLISEDKNKQYYTMLLDHNPPLFDHQKEAVEYGLNNDNWLLLDGCGLGKTAQIIALAEELKAQKGVEHCLIVCGINTLKANWEKEIKKFSDLPCRILGKRINRKGKVTYAPVKERLQELAAPMDAFFIICNIEMVRNEDFIAAIKNSKNKIDMMVVDEIHKCGSGAGKQSQQTQALVKLNWFKYKIGLTGTMLTNSPLSSWTALRWIGKEKSPLSSFKQQYCVYGGFGGYQIVGYKNIDQLKAIIDSCSLRRTKDMLNIPPKTVITETIELEPQHRAFYDAVKEGIKEECDKVILNHSNVMAMMIRLRQATSCPSALTTESITSSKLQRAVDLTEEIIDQGEKVVILGTFKESVRELQKLLAEYNPVIGTGDIPDEEVSRNVDRFQEDPECKVFIGTYAKSSTGITLNAATYEILIDEPWGYYLLEQAQDRIHRVTNTKPVFIYQLVCQDTVDEVVDKVVNTKKALSDFMIDDIQDEDTMRILQEYLQDM